MSQSAAFAGTRPGAANLSRKQWLLLGALALLLLVAVLVRGQPAPATPYAPDASAPQGTLALWLWLEELGYTVEYLDAPWDTVPDDDPFGLFFVFPGVQSHDEAAAQALLAWVEAGGTLVLVGPDATNTRLVDAFGVRPHAGATLVSHLRQVQPLLPAAPPSWGAPGRVTGLDLTDAPAAAPIVVAEPVAGDQARITLAVQPVGAGRVWHVDAVHAFTNARLRAAEQAAIVPEVLRDLESDATVWVDVYHLYPPPAEGTEITSLRAWLYGTRPGIAVTLACLLALAYLVFQGVRLGPPLEPAQWTRRRPAAEYVAALAGLYQRGKHRTAVAQQIKRRLKLRLAHSAGMAAHDDDGRFVDELRARRADLASDEIAALADLLGKLAGPLDDAELLEAAQAAQRFDNPG